VLSFVFRHLREEVFRSGIFTKHYEQSAFAGSQNQITFITNDLEAYRAMAI